MLNKKWIRIPADDIGHERWLLTVLNGSCDLWVRKEKGGWRVEGKLNDTTIFLVGEYVADIDYARFQAESLFAIYLDGIANEIRERISSHYRSPGQTWNPIT
jgi:hypothetical protein